MSGQSTTAGGERCEFEHDDGAYILGALSPAQRAEYERHLAQCPECKQSLAELAVLPGLLGRLHNYPPSPDLSSRATAPATLLARLLAAAGEVRRAERWAQHRRRLRIAVAAAIASGALASAVGIGVHLYDGGRTMPAIDGMPTPSPSAQPTFNLMWANPDAVAVTAEIALSPMDGGTLVSVRCHYSGGGSKAWALWLVIYPRNEEAEPIGSWVATPGRDLSMTGLTHYTPDKIDRIEVQDYHRTTLLWWRP